MNKPFDQWPQIALNNRVLFTDSSYHQVAGNGFLIKWGSDTLACTCKHALWVAKSKKMTAVNFEGTLKSWIMHPKQNLADSIVIEKLINVDKNELLQGPGSSILDRDWLLFSIKHNTTHLQPLIPRFTEPDSGEKVYLIGCSSRDKSCNQKIFEGRYIKTDGAFRVIEFGEEVNFIGISGSAVIDSEGYLIGLLTRGYKQKEFGKKFYSVSSTEYLKTILPAKGN